jgi:hypothetical protein
VLLHQFAGGDRGVVEFGDVAVEPGIVVDRVEDGLALQGLDRHLGVGPHRARRSRPDRRPQALLEAVYVDEVEALARVADELGDLDPWEALAVWLRRFVGYATTKRAVVEGLNLDSPMFGACIALIHRAGEPLLEAAQDAGKARNDVGFEDVRLLINGIASSNFADDAQRERVLGMALDGIKTRS